MDRSDYRPIETVKEIWTRLNLPSSSLGSLHLIDDSQSYSTCFKVDHLACSTVALSAIAAAQYRSVRHSGPLPSVTVPTEHACVEFKSEKLYTLNGTPAQEDANSIGGLHKVADGNVRVHDSFPNHRSNALKTLGLPTNATKKDVAEKMLKWKKVDLETEALKQGAVIYALRSFEEWDALPQSSAVADFPIILEKIRDGKVYMPEIDSLSSDKCLKGIRVVEMSRVIAAPVAGKTLAAHGADVLWVTSPHLPDLPSLDIDVSRGKRTVQLDIHNAEDKAKLIDLLRGADVFIQGYRPGSLASKGLSPEALLKINPNLIMASLSAFGPTGPWSHRRGFDSMVQNSSGLNVYDAERSGTNVPARVLPCQALDHGAGYLLATGIMAALYKRATEGGAYEVKMSLAAVMKYLRSLGTHEGKSGYERRNYNGPEDAEQYLETRLCDFGELRAVKHSASIEGVEIGWEVMPKKLGSDEPVWR